MGKKWKESIDLKDTWEEYANGTFEIEDVVDEVTAQIRLCDSLREEPGLAEILDEFDVLYLAPDPEEQKEKKFDEMMDKLYDWADTGRRLLIVTA